MGANTSVLDQKVVSKQINNTLNSFISNFTANAEASSKLKQSMSVDFSGADLTGCPINVSQVASNKLSALVNLSSDQLNDISVNLKNQIDNMLSSKLEQKNTGLNLGQANIAKTKQDVRNYLTNNISNLLQSNINSSVAVDSTGEQVINAKFALIKCKESGINISQDMVLETIADNAATSVVKNINDIVASNTTENKVTSETSQINTGLTLSFGIAIVAAIIFILILGYMFGWKIIAFLTFIGIIVDSYYLSYFINKKDKTKQIITGVAMGFLILLFLISVIKSFTQRNEGFGDFEERARYAYENRQQQY
jgi:Na+-transporting methylmalonyl-CoA/oxaloacetate decarboxylase gamma subunit